MGVAEEEGLRATEIQERRGEIVDKQIRIFTNSAVEVTHGVGSGEFRVALRIRSFAGKFSLLSVRC